MGTKSKALAGRQVELITTHSTEQRITAWVHYHYYDGYDMNIIVLHADNRAAH
jgi:hypothetical protein